MFEELPEGQTHSYGDGCNPPHEKPMTWQERLENLIMSMGKKDIFDDLNDLKAFVANEIEQATEEEGKSCQEALKQMRVAYNSQCEQDRNDALEEAAKVAEEVDYVGCGCWCMSGMQRKIIEAIRALKKP